jgi:hypothetical protein
MIFVFCSNLLGQHTDEISQLAVSHYGAQDGIGSGFLGSSYALPVRSKPSEITSTVFDAEDYLLSDDEIIANIKIWYQFAQTTKNHFKLFTQDVNADFANLLREAGPMPSNITLDKNLTWFITKTRRAKFS